MTPNIGSSFKTILIVVSVVVIGPLCTITSSGDSIFPSVVLFPPDDYMDVGRMFFNALQDNNLSSAQNLADPSTWNRINNWIASHQSVETCPIDFRDLDNWFDREDNGLVGGIDSDPNLARVSVFEMCFETGYSFSINDIELRYSDDRWIVINWEEPNETIYK
ncbi:MAG: hypothetical protein ACW97O_11620 [Candidatus Thorarchaeota archaeon]|jgi:hypothetical protein